HTLHTFFFFYFYSSPPHLHLHSFPTRRYSDLVFRAHYVPERKCAGQSGITWCDVCRGSFGLLFTGRMAEDRATDRPLGRMAHARSEEHTSELQSLRHLVCRLLLEKKKKNIKTT